MLKKRTQNKIYNFQDYRYKEVHIPKSLTERFPKTIKSQLDYMTFKKKLQKRYLQIKNNKGKHKSLTERR